MEHPQDWRMVGHAAGQVKLAIALCGAAAAR
jgi:hypothetical protein